MTTKIFSELGLSPELLKAVEKIGFEQASPIQAAAIPVLLQGRDVVGQSQTGSGKTAAFALPAIEKVDPLRREPQVLILCPTRELAVQVSEEVHRLAFFKRGVRALPIYGGQSYERQFSGLKQGAQIIIGTPGRLMDHMRRGTLRLETLKMVILDEVDVMLDMGFRDDIEQILKDTPAARQTVFFSATIPRAIQELIQKYSRDPETVRMEQKTLTVPTVEQIYFEVDRRFKIELLTRLIDIHDLKLGIIFCNTKRMVDDLVDHLNAQGYSADRLHGDMSQGMRDRVMGKFRRSGLEFLVATDVAARGIDVDDVEVVFNYDLPYDVEDYLHRIGRTGRAGKSGKAISFVGGREVFQIHNIERYTKVKIARGHAPTSGQVEEARANVFLEKARATLKSGDFKRQDHLVERLLDEGYSSTDIASALLHHLQGGGAPPAGKQVSQVSRETSPREPSVPRPAAPPPAARPEPPPATAPLEQPPAPRVEIAAPRPETRPARREAPPLRPPPAFRRALPSSQRPPAPFAGPPKSFAPRERPSVRPSVRPPARPFTPREPFSGRPAPVRPPLRRAAPPYSRPAPGGGPAPAPLPLRRPSPPPAATPLSAARPDAPRPSHPRPPTPRVRPASREKFSNIPLPRASRRPPANHTRLHINVGVAMGVVPGDVVGAILGETGLPPTAVGMVDIRDRHLFVEVDSEHTNSIISKLNRATLKGRNLKVKRVTLNPPPGEGDGPASPAPAP